MHPIEIAEHGLVEREIKYSLKEITVLESTTLVLRARFPRKSPVNYVRKKVRKMIRKQIKKLRKFLFPRVLSPSL